MKKHDDRYKLGSWRLAILLLVGSASIAAGPMPTANAADVPYGTESVPDSSIYTGAGSEYGRSTLPASAGNNNTWTESYGVDRVPDSGVASRAWGYRYQLPSDAEADQTKVVTGKAARNESVPNDSTQNKKSSPAPNTPKRYRRCR